MPIRSKSIERSLGLSQPKGWHQNKKRISSSKSKIRIAAKGKGK
jgi:hypothetical protein